MEILNLMLENNESHELHDEIVAMTCRKYGTDTSYSKDIQLKDIFHLTLRTWE